MRTAFEAAHELVFASVVHGGGLLCSRGCGDDVDEDMIPLLISIRWLGYWFVDDGVVD